MKITLQDVENEKKIDSTGKTADGGADSGAVSPEKDLSGEEMARRKRVSEMTRKEKLAYYWDYYRTPAIVLLVVLAVVIFTAHDIASNRPTGFEAELINAYIQDPVEFAQEAGEAIGMDLDRESCLISTDPIVNITGYDSSSMYTMQKLMTRLAAGELNVLAGDEAVFDHYASVEAAIIDLRTVLSDEEQAFYEPRFVWKQVKDPDGNLSEPMPLGIRLDDAPRVIKRELYPNGGAVIGIIATKEHTDRAVAFINYLFGR